MSPPRCANQRQDENTLLHGRSKNPCRRELFFDPMRHCADENDVVVIAFHPALEFAQLARILNACLGLQ